MTKKKGRSEEKAALLAEARELHHEAVDALWDGDLTVHAVNSMVRQVFDAVVVLPDPLDALSDKAFAVLLDEVTQKLGHVIRKIFKRDTDRLKRRIAKAKDNGRHKAAARLQKRLDRIPVRQSTS